MDRFGRGIERGRGNKKLTEAAEAWACARIGLDRLDRAASIDAAAAAEFSALGVQVDQQRDNGDDGVFEVLAENWRTVSAFLALETQWRIVPVQGHGLLWVGLDYAAAHALHGNRPCRRSFASLIERLAVMERAALPILNGGRP